MSNKHDISTLIGRNTLYSIFMRRLQDTSADVRFKNKEIPNKITRHHLVLLPSDSSEELSPLGHKS